MSVTLSAMHSAENHIEYFLLKQRSLDIWSRTGVNYEKLNVEPYYTKVFLLIGLEWDEGLMGIPDKRQEEILKFTIITVGRPGWPRRRVGGGGGVGAGDPLYGAGGVGAVLPSIIIIIH